jgi:hypothetical protein
LDKTKYLQYRERIIRSGNKDAIEYLIDIEIERLDDMWHKEENTGSLLILQGRKQALEELRLTFAPSIAEKQKAAEGESNG